MKMAIVATEKVSWNMLKSRAASPREPTQPQHRSHTSVNSKLTWDGARCHLENILVAEILGISNESVSFAVC